MKQPITLREYFEEVRKEARQKVIQECGISERMLLNWIGGRTPVPKLAREKILEITGREIQFIEAVDKRKLRRKTA